VALRFSERSRVVTVLMTESDVKVFSGNAAQPTRALGDLDTVITPFSAWCKSAFKCAECTFDGDSAVVCGSD
jgi:hypothetical protein